MASVSIIFIDLGESLIFFSCTTRSIPSTSTNSPLASAERLNSGLGTLPIAMSTGPGGPASGSLFEHQFLAAIGLSLTPQHFKDAVSLKDRPLFQNYKNWLAMARLLDPTVIHMPGLAGEVTTTTFSVNDATEVLRYFNWAPTSYYKKRRLFLWAYSAAYMSWNGPIGSKCLYLLSFYRLLKEIL